MTAPSPLPDLSGFRPWGYRRSKSRAVRELYAQRCSVSEISQFLAVSREFISQALRWKSGAKIGGVK